MNTVFAYLSLLIAPLFAGVADIFLMPLSVSLGRIFRQELIAGVLFSFFGALVTFYVVYRIFLGLDVPMGVLPVLLILGLHVNNGLMRIKTRGKTQLELGYITGDVLGICAGVLVWLF